MHLGIEYYPLYKEELQGLHHQKTLGPFIHGIPEEKVFSSLNGKSIEDIYPMKAYIWPHILVFIPC